MSMVPRERMLRGVRSPIRSLRALMGGIIIVSSSLLALTRVLLTFSTVHVEPGNDKYEFAKYIADWILQRSGPLENARAKL